MTYRDLSASANRLVASWPPIATLALYAVAGAAVAAEVAGYLAWRSAMLHWGTQAGDSTEPLPGDELVPRPRVQSTRATTIDAPSAPV